MKQLLYTICFGACALSFFDMHASDMSNPYQRTDAELQQIIENQRQEKIKLFSYDQTALLTALGQKEKK